MHSFLESVARAAILLVPAACLGEHATRSVPVAELLPWFSTDTVSLRQLVAELGAPRSRMEKGRILIWPVDDMGKAVKDFDALRRAESAEPIEGGLHHLVVVLRDPEQEDSRIERASLVRPW